MRAETLKQWAERICGVTSTETSQLSAAIDGADSALPTGVTKVEVDDREVGLGGVWLRLAPGEITRRQMETTFGAGEEIVRLHPGHPFKVMTTVEVPGAPLRCTVIAEYPGDGLDADLRGLYLRTDRAR